MVRSTRTNAESRCPACLAVLSGASDPDGGAAPKPGDLSVCIYCSVALKFNTDLTVRLLRTQEFEALPPNVRAMLNHCRATVAVLHQRLKP